MEKYSLQIMGDYYKIIHFKRPVNHKNNAHWKNCCESCKNFDDCQQMQTYYEATGEFIKDCPYFLPLIYSEATEPDELERKKRKNNLCRARSKIKELALCNEWDWFITLTLDKNKAVSDRYDLEMYKKKLSKWLNNYNERKANVKYILIPEMHKDGAWHMHGLIKGIPKEDICKFGPEAPRDLREYFNWEPYSKKFGFCSLGEIRSHAKVATYITKYVTKNMITCEKMGIPLGNHLYYASKGLNKAIEYLKEITVEAHNIEFPECNDYCDVTYIPINELKIQYDETFGYVFTKKHP